MSERIGIYGGTFDPVHLGHLVAAADAVERLRLDRLFWVPARRSPHKPDGPTAGAERRCAMIGAAIAGDPRMALCRWEVRRRGLSFTIDTVRRFRATYPGAELWFLIGSDSLFELPLWREVGTLSGLCRFAVVPRPGYPARRARARLPPALRARGRLAILPGRAIGISSTDLRRRLAVGLPIRYLVPAAVEAMIREHGLYAARGPAAEGWGGR